MESIEKLRGLASEISKGDIDAHLKSGPLGDGVNIDWLAVWHRKFDELINSIQAEVDEKYMLLPVDADGVPIHMGDTLQLGDTRGEVVALTYCPANGKLPWEWQCDTGDWYNTAFARHVKPRTVEDVLLDLTNEVASQGHQIGLTANEIIAKYASELRMRDAE